MYELHAALFEIANREMNEDALYIAEFQKKLLEVAQCLKRTIELLQYETEGTREKLICDSARKLLLELKEFIGTVKADKQGKAQQQVPSSPGPGQPFQLPPGVTPDQLPPGVVLPPNFQPGNMPLGDLQDAAASVPRPFN